MADFVSYAAAEIRAKAKVADGTWIAAHVMRATTGGKIGIRVQQKMAPTSAATRQQGGWVELTDDAAV